MRDRLDHSRKPDHETRAPCEHCRLLRRENEDLRRELANDRARHATERAAIGRELGVARDVLERLLGVIGDRHV